MFGANHRKKFPQDKVLLRTFEQSKLLKHGARLPHSRSCSTEAVKGMLMGKGKGCRIKLRGAGDQIKPPVILPYP